jgi:hypothetical protein
VSALLAALFSPYARPPDAARPNIKTLCDYRTVCYCSVKIVIGLEKSREAALPPGGGMGYQNCDEKETHGQQQ